MREVTAETQTQEVKYNLTYFEFESLAEAVEFWNDQGLNGEEVARDIINASQRQNALQGGKDEVRQAVNEYGPDSAEVAEAIEAHQEAAATYRIGRPRGGSTGLTKTKAREIGATLREKLGEDELLALAREHGIEV